MKFRYLYINDIFKAEYRASYISSVYFTLLLLLCIICILPHIAHSQATSSSQDFVPESVAQTIDEVRGNVEPEFVVDLISRANSLLEKDVFLGRFDNGFGINNSAQITQVGDQNITVLSQYGQKNTASIRLKGNQNRVNALQDGIGNRLGVAVLGSYNEIPVSQTGMGNELLIELTDVNGLVLPEPGIEQIGNGVPLIIQITPNITP